MRNSIRTLIKNIEPYDDLEKNHIEDAIRWLTSDLEIYRIKKPDIPPKHLVSYFALIDRSKKSLLLILHKKAGLWLLPGGHVEKNEHPYKTVEREIQEELHTSAHFIKETPFFMTVTKTVNIESGHTDVSLWYLLKGDSSKNFQYDRREFDDCQWFTFDEVLVMKKSKLDPHMHRFVNKLHSYL